MIYLLILLPVVMAAVTFALPCDRGRPWLLPLGALAHLALVVSVVFRPRDGPPLSGLGGWLLLDPLGKLVLVFQSGLFFLCSLYAPGYLALRPDRPNRVFCANLFLMLGIMTLVVLSHHLGLMWVAMEATTLVTAPLIYFNHNARSLEATWKYLLIGSVGHRAGPAGFVLPRLRVAQGRAGIDVALRPTGQGRPAPLASLAPRRVRAALHRLRHQDGPGADAHLEAGRLRRSAGDGGHAPGRGRHELCLPGDLAGL